MDALASFSRVSSVLCFGCHVVSSGSFGCSRVETCCSPLQSLNSLLRYGFGTVLDFFRWLVPRWASSGPARVGGRSCENGKHSFEEFHRVQESQERQERERAHSRVVLNCPSLDIAHRRLVQSERRYGAEPRLHGWFLQGTFMWRKITFYPCIKTLTRFTHL